MDGSLFSDELLLALDLSELAVQDHVAEGEADAAFIVAGLELLHELADGHLTADADSLLDGLFDLLQLLAYAFAHLEAELLAL